MTRRRSWPAALPLAVLAGGGTAAAALTAGLAAVVALSALGALDGRTGASVLVAVVVGLLPAAVTGYGASRLSASLHELNADAVRRLTEPGTSMLPRPRSRGALLRASAEFAALERTLDALHLRVRVADELAERRRRTAETASAGMYELLSGLVAAEEGTRGQLSAELHDTVAQSLALARTLLADVLSSGPVPAQLERAADYVAEAEEQVRAVMARTRPPALRDGDLARAVSMLRDDMAARYGLAVEVSWPDEPYPLSLVTAITVYRFFQEALVNVVKHADVDEAVISLQVSEHEIVAEVHDEGPGFDPAAVRPDKGRHVGLGLLRERVRLAGGSLTVDAAPGAGTRLALRLPRVGAAARTGPRSAALLAG
ncbi:MAG: sensor histidine kinase [Frankiaceae bacterium]